MNEMKNEMKKRIALLLALTFKANKLIEQAQQNNYTVNIECWSSTGKGATTNNLRLTKFTKDFSKDAGRDVSPQALKNTLEQITKELLQLGNEEYQIDISSRRPNGRDALYVEEVFIKLYNSDYTQKYYT